MKKFFTLIAVAAMAMTAGAQEVGLFLHRQRQAYPWQRHEGMESWCNQNH